MNIIFLDMDGVVNSKKSFYDLRKLFSSREKLNEYLCEDRGVPFYIDPSLRLRLNEILTKVPNCKVVWSTSWRLGLRDSKLFISGRYNTCGFNKGSFLDYTPINGNPRWMQILEWLNLKGNLYSIEKCIIIDDDPDAEIPDIIDKNLKIIFQPIIEKYNPKFFQTNNEYGLSEDIKNDILNYFDK